MRWAFGTWGNSIPTSCPLRGIAHCARRLTASVLGAPPPATRPPTPIRAWGNLDVDCYCIVNPFVCQYYNSLPLVGQAICCSYIDVCFILLLHSMLQNNHFQHQGQVFLICRSHHTHYSHFHNLPLNNHLVLVLVSLYLCYHCLVVCFHYYH